MQYGFKSNIAVLGFHFEIFSYPVIIFRIETFHVRLGGHI